MNFLLVSLQEYKDVLELPMLAKTSEMGSSAVLSDPKRGICWH